MFNLKIEEMKQTNFTIFFFLLKKKVLRTGEAPILVRVTIDGKKAEARIQRSIDPKLWDQSKNCSKGRDRLSKELNDYMQSLSAKLKSIHSKLLMQDALITPRCLLTRLFNKEEKRTVLSFMKSHIEEMETLIGIDYEKVTINRYWNCYRSAKSVIQQFYRKEDITFPELSTEFIRKFEYYLKVERKLCRNTLVRYMKCFKKITNMALDEGWMDKNPFGGIKFTQEETDPVFLTLEELKRIEEQDFPIERMALTKDMFIFSCYTGLAFKDAQELKPSDIYTDNKGKSWIRKGRHKIKKNKARCTSNIPLLKPALEILEKYKGHSKTIEKGCCLPIYCNQTMNGYLKSIAAVCGINKNLTTHVARHTFGTTVTLANKVSLQNVSKMMGHTSTRMTEHYARVMDQTIMEDMENVATILAL